MTHLLERRGTPDVGVSEVAGGAQPFGRRKALKWNPCGPPSRQTTPTEPQWFRNRQPDHKEQDHDRFASAITDAGQQAIKDADDPGKERNHLR
jgi:hypothetical protein